MEQLNIIGLDLAKNVFQAHGMRADGSVAFRKKIARVKLQSFFASVPKCLVAMEACASAHHWARQINAFGHEVRLIAQSHLLSETRTTQRTPRRSPKQHLDQPCALSR